MLEIGYFADVEDNEDHEFNETMEVNTTTVELEFNEKTIGLEINEYTDQEFNENMEEPEFNEIIGEETPVLDSSDEECDEELDLYYRLCKKGWSKEDIFKIL
jgi:hypothetical protein